MHVVSMRWAPIDKQAAESYASGGMHVREKWWLTLKAGAATPRSSSSLSALRACCLAAFLSLACSLRDSFALPGLLLSSAAENSSALRNKGRNAHSPPPADTLHLMSRRTLHAIL